jgi:hypothetical protein
MTHTVNATVGLLQREGASLRATAARYTAYGGGQALIRERNAVMLPSCRVGAAVQNVAHCHETAPLLEHVGSAIGLLDFIADDMRKRRLDNLILNRRALARPGPQQDWAASA